MRIELHPEADAEFAAQVAYYDEREPGLGQRFYGEVIASLEWIALNPTLPRLRQNYRRVNLRVFPFYIAYVAEKDLIWVLAVAHGLQRAEILDRSNERWVTRQPCSGFTRNLQPRIPLRAGRCCERS